MIPNTDIFKILETNANKIKDNVDKSIKKSVENLDKSNGKYLKIFVFKKFSGFNNAVVKGITEDRLTISDKLDKKTAMLKNKN